MNHNSMKNLYEYIQQQILEEESSKKSSLERGDIKFTIWEAPDKKVSWIKNNEAYQKIEYKYINKKTPNTKSKIKNSYVNKKSNNFISFTICAKKPKYNHSPTIRENQN